MSRNLLDVNVLLALVWPRHEAHGAAHVWFAKSGRKGWATNPLTQLGVLRLLTNPSVTQGVVNPKTAWETVHEATQHEAHEFWPIDSAPAIALKALAGRLHRHQQWTDAALLAHAIERDGVLVTFDARIGAIANRELHGRVLVLRQT